MESNFDIALLIHEAPANEMNERLPERPVDIKLDCGKVLSAIKIDYPSCVECQSTLLFYRNIELEGVA